MADPGEAVARRRTDTLGMWVFLTSEITMFGALFMAIAVSRWLHPQAWKAASHHLHIWLGTANTGLLLTSSLLVAIAVEQARTDRRGRTAALLAGAVVLGLAFLGIKGTEYWLEYRDGLMPGTIMAEPRESAGQRLFFDLYFLGTGLHALHLSIGCLWLSLLAWRRAKGSAVEVAGLYWHFVDVVWVFLYPVFYLAASR